MADDMPEPVVLARYALPMPVPIATARLALTAEYCRVQCHGEPYVVTDGPLYRPSTLTIVARRAHLAEGGELS